MTGTWQCVISFSSLCPSKLVRDKLEAAQRKQRCSRETPGASRPTQGSPQSVAAL